MRKWLLFMIILYVSIYKYRLIFILCLESYLNVLNKMCSKEFNMIIDVMVKENSKFEILKCYLLSDGFDWMFLFIEEYE